jgi:hypothetical protein
MSPLLRYLVSTSRFPSVLFSAEVASSRLEGVLCWSSLFSRILCEYCGNDFVLWRVERPVAGVSLLYRHLLWQHARSTTSPAIRISSDLSCVSLVLKNISMLWLLPGFNLIFDICCFRGFDLFSYFCCFSARESGIPKNRVWLRTMHSAHDALPVPSWSFLISILLLWIYPVHMLVIYIYLFILFKHICLVLYFLLLDYIYIFFLYKVIFA